MGNEVGMEIQLSNVGIFYIVWSMLMWVLWFHYHHRGT